MQGKSLSSLSLTSLEVTRCDNFLDEGIASLTFLTKLKELICIDCVQLTGSTFDLLPPYLETLTVSRCPWITDLSVKNIFLLSKLSSLTLSFCPRVVGGTLDSLPRTLKRLDLRGCAYLMCVETLIPLSNLDYLNVSLTPITDLYLPFLEKLQIDEIVIGPCEPLPSSQEIVYYDDAF